MADPVTEAGRVSDAEWHAASLAVHRAKYAGLVSWEADPGKRSVARTYARVALDAAAQVRAARPTASAEDVAALKAEIERLMRRRDAAETAMAAAHEVLRLCEWSKVTEHGRRCPVCGNFRDQSFNAHPSDIGHAPDCALRAAFSAQAAAPTSAASEVDLTPRGDVDVALHTLGELVSGLPPGPKRSASISALGALSVADSRFRFAAKFSTPAAGGEMPGVEAIAEGGPFTAKLGGRDLWLNFQDGTGFVVSPDMPDDAMTALAAWLNRKAAKIRFATGGVATTA